MTESELLYPLLAASSVLYGLVAGSFANVAISRIPDDRSLWPRSACPACGAPIAGYDNVPVLSYLWLRGRCRACKTAIPTTYPLVELLGGALAWLCFVRIVPDPSMIDAPHLMMWAAALLFCTSMLIAAFVDLRYRIIPDETSIYAVPGWVIIHAALEASGYDGWLGIGARQAVLGAAAGGGFFATVSILGEALAGREVLGWGDVKLLAAIGAFAGVFPGAFIILLWASLAASVVGVGAMIYARRRLYLPLGPSLAGAALVLSLLGPSTRGTDLERPNPSLVGVPRREAERSLRALWARVRVRKSWANQRRDHGL